jgi:two-component system chemotaxis response regulator CheB
MPPPKHPDIVALVASAGGVLALIRVLSNLPAGLEASVVVLLHLSAAHRSVLAEVLQRHADLPVREARDGEALAAGMVRVAPPDAHLTIVDGVVRLDEGAPVQHVRPSADRLLGSLVGGDARRHLAVVLSGTGHDATAGAIALRAAGGTVFAQDEATSDYFGMPGSAIAAGAVDRVLPIDDIARAVIEFVENHS